MKRFVLFFVLSLTYAFAADPGDISRYDNQLTERDWEELRNFLNTKRTIDVAEKGNNLTISGDVRTRWRNMNERVEDIDLRPRKPKKENCDGCDCPEVCGCGRGCVEDEGCFINRCNGECEVQFPKHPDVVPIFIPLCKPVSRNDFDIKLNLNIDYVCEGAWGVAQVSFDNTAGVNGSPRGCGCDPEGFHGSGFDCDINLKKAYFGYNIFCCGDTRFDIEIGRRNLYNVFDSKVQFCSRFDGVLLKYSSVWGCVADWYLKGAGFVVDEKVDQFSYVFEGGLLNLCDCGLDLKYSLINWRQKGKNRCGRSDPRGMKFLNSQLTFIYHFFADILFVPARFYGAVVLNHNDDHLYPTPRVTNSESEEGEGLLPILHPCQCGCDKDVVYRHARHENVAWYVGFRFGEVIYKGDWAIEIEYQSVDPFAVPDDDCCGVGRGNLLKERNTYAGRGNSNYRGVHIEALYALTDNLNLDVILEHSQELKRQIGGTHGFSKFQLEAIYAF